MRVYAMSSCSPLIPPAVMDNQMPGTWNSGDSDVNPLVSFQDAEAPLSHIKHTAGDKLRSNLKLLLFRGSFFIAGVVLVVVGGIASHFHPVGSYSGCQGNTTNSTEPG